MVNFRTYSANKNANLQAPGTILAHVKCGFVRYTGFHDALSSRSVNGISLSLSAVEHVHSSRIQIYLEVFQPSLLELLQEHGLLPAARIRVVALPHQEDVDRVVERVDPNLKQIELVVDGQGLDDPPRLLPSPDALEVEVGAEEDLLGDTAVQAIVDLGLAGALPAAVALQQVDAGREAFCITD